MRRGSAITGGSPAGRSTRTAWRPPPLRNVLRARSTRAATSEGSGDTDSVPESMRPASSRSRMRPRMWAACSAMMRKNSRISAGSSSAASSSSASAEPLMAISGARSSWLTRPRNSVRRRSISSSGARSCMVTTSGRTTPPSARISVPLASVRGLRPSDTESTLDRGPSGHTTGRSATRKGSWRSRKCAKSRGPSAHAAITTTPVQQGRDGFREARRPESVRLARGRRSRPELRQPDDVDAGNLNRLRGGNSGSVDLVYADPPFNSKRKPPSTDRRESGGRRSTTCNICRTSRDYQQTASIPSSIGHTLPECALCNNGDGACAAPFRTSRRPVVESTHRAAFACPWSDAVRTLGRATPPGRYREHGRARPECARKKGLT